MLPKATRDRVRQVVDDEWGTGLIRSWNDAGWVTLSRRIADKIARLIGARPGEVVVADSTSVNLYKILSAAIAVVESNAVARQRKPPRPAAGRRRNRIVSERTNFPSDLYIADSLARAHGFELVLVDADDIAAQLDDRLAILMLTHVNYRTGRMHRMADVTRAAHAAGGRGDLGPRALGRRGARRPPRRRRRLRDRMRLQISEWRPGRAGIRLGTSASRRLDGSRGLVAAARRLVRSRRAVRVHHRPTGRPPA